MGLEGLALEGLSGASECLLCSSCTLLQGRVVIEWGAGTGGRCTLTPEPDSRGLSKGGVGEVIDLPGLDMEGELGQMEHHKHTPLCGPTSPCPNELGHEIEGAL